MFYVTAFFEGLLSFISPCVLPMIPLYITYLAGTVTNDQGRGFLMKNTLSFILGFTVLFVLMGATASALGGYLSTHMVLLNRIAGVLLIIFSLMFFGVRIPFLSGTRKMTAKFNVGKNIFTSFLFGFIFAVGWSPCTGPFLGSALMMAANQETVANGIFTLLIYSMGIAIPFFLSALLLNELKGVFGWIKSHYRVIQIICGVFFVVMGLLMIFGVIGAVS